ncbi:SPOR domain-containing protein [Hyphomicrobium denitrificans]|nr:SPOR domain-containing protein [Hyphomicrobium denitrificans]
MTQFRKLARGTLLAAAACVCAFASIGMGAPSTAEAKKAKAPAPQSAAQSSEDSKLSPEEQKKKASRQAYDAGLKDFANGRYQPAIDQLSSALKTGGLSSTEMAKALYTRGIAYKKQKQPGLAISDLTSALWLKNGLSAGDRETATAERADAYKMAGIEDTGKGPERVVGTPTSTTKPASTAAATPAAGPNAGSAGLSAAAIAQAAANNNTSNDSGAALPVTRQDPSSTAAQDAARARAAYAPVNSLAGSAATGGTSEPAPAAQTSSPAPAPSSSFGSGVTGFFSNMFGGSSSAPAAGTQAPASVTTASTGTVAETSSWSSATVVNEGSAAKSADKTRQVTAAAKPTRATKGKYKVHIAALRSRAEAEALAQQLIAQHGADLDNHVPTVDEAVIGSMGTFYRVRINGYASQEEPRSLCDKLRTSGLDCLVVTN